MNSLRNDSLMEVKSEVTGQEPVQERKVTGQEPEQEREVTGQEPVQKHEVSITCEEPLVIVKGTNVSFSAAFEDMATLKDGGCAGLETEGKFKFLNVFALDTVHIDRDLPFPGLPRWSAVAVIAPRWEVTGAVKIDLNGSQGKSECGGRSNCRAKDGVGQTTKGEDGAQGGAGGPGGAFFGIRGQFGSGSGLNITADGGSGGEGQNGGNGVEGTDGKNPTLPPDASGPSEPQAESSCDNNRCHMVNQKLFGFRCELTGSSTNGPSTYIANIRIFGEEGKGGGDGGDGGGGGKGGSSGTILLFELGSRSQIAVSSREGCDGEGGRGGAGGRGGRNGDDLDTKCTRRVTVSWGYNYSTIWNLEKTISKNRALSGRDGKCGTRDRNPEHKETLVDAPKPALVLNMYKSFVRESLSHRSNEASTAILHFLHQLDSNRDIRNIYDTLAFLDEMNGIEEQFRDLREEVDLIPFYQSLLGRVSDYAKSPKPGESSKEHKKVLSYLYTAALGRIYNLKDNSESNLVTRVAEHLDSVRGDIESLKESQKTRNKMEIIDKYKSGYKSSIDGKIKEAESLIGKLITPEIDNIGKKMDNDIETLMAETLALEEQAQVEKEKLIKKKEELEKAMVLGGFLDVFKIVGQALSFFGPAGAVAGLAIGASSEIAGSLLLDDQTGPGETLELPKGVISDLQSLEQQMKTTRDNKVARLKTLLDEVVAEAKQYPEYLNDTTTKVAQIKEKLNGLDEKKLEFDTVQTLEDELKQELERKKSDLNSKKASEKAKKAKAVVEKFEKAVKLSDKILDAYDHYKNDKQRLDLMNDAIEQAEDKFQMLKDYEGKIYSTIAPLVQNMKADITKVESQLQNKSRVSLDVTKWKVRDALRDMKSRMQKLTGGFTVEGDFLSGIEKLEEAMDTLIDIYDHIQNYQEQQDLANYITDVTSATANGISITNPVLIKAVGDLEFVMTSNVVLQQYKTAMEAFKQFVFPFAHLYFKELDIPSHLKPGNDTDSLISQASEQIKGLKSKLDKYAQSIENQDEYIGRGEFSSRYVSTDPFFVWRNEQNGEMISNLLSGREVLVKADLMSSDIRDKDAVKFRVIALDFRSKNNSLQAEIDRLVKGFEVRAVHLGNSYYRYDNKIYLIETNSHAIEFYIEKKPDGTPVRTGGVYDKIKKGDFMLSPYASWKIKLLNRSRDISYDDLHAYKNGIDLELAGEGHYVNNGELDGLDLHMEKYYRAIYTYELTDPRYRHKKVAKASLLQEIIGWLSRMRLPNLSILPGAEASVMEYDLVNRKEFANIMDDIKEIFELENNMEGLKHASVENSPQSITLGDKLPESDAAKAPIASLLDYVTMPFVNCLELLKHVFSSKLPSNTGNMNPPENTLVDYAYYIVEDVANQPKNLAISTGDDKSNEEVMGSASGSLDVIGNLALGQLLVHKMFGANETLRATNYISPALERVLKVNHLAKEVLPILENSCSSTDGNRYCENYDQPQWYRDLFLNN